jgi:hypothetical protein
VRTGAARATIGVPEGFLMLLDTYDLVDLARYPIAALGDPDGAALVQQCREALRRDGTVVLPQFLSAAARVEIAREARESAPQAFFCDNTHNVYLAADDVSFAADHPRRRRLHTVVGSVAFDLLAPQSRLRALYNWDPLVEFVRAVIDVPELYRLADPLGACSINVFRPGDQHEWHFDEAEYSTTIMLQEAGDGGFFEYVPHVRQPDGSEADQLSRLLDGDESGVQRLAFSVGDLSIFNGRRSLHRVTEVLGDTTRLVAVLTFNTKPGVTNSEAVRRLFWGRAG